MRKDFIHDVSTMLSCDESNYNAHLRLTSGDGNYKIRFRLSGYFALTELQKMVVAIKERREVYIIEFWDLVFIRFVPKQQSNAFPSPYESMIESNILSQKHSIRQPVLYKGKIQCFGFSIYGITLKTMDGNILEASIKNEKFVNLAYCIIYAYLYDSNLSITFCKKSKAIINIRLIETIDLKRNPLVFNLKRFHPYDYSIIYMVFPNLRGWFVYPKSWKGIEFWDSIIRIIYNYSLEKEILITDYQKVFHHYAVDTSDLNGIFMHVLKHYNNKEYKRLLPKYYLDFKKKKCLYRKHKFRMHDKQGWTEEDKSFLNLIPKNQYYWIVDGIDYSKML